MKRWLTMILVAAAVVGCDRFQPARTPTPKPTAVPTSAPAPRETPSLTPLPPTILFAPTEMAALTDTPEATDTAAATGTPTATVTNTPVRVRPAPKATATNTAIALKYPAPVLIEPKPGDTHIESKDDLLFKWNPVADLGPGECYQVTLRVINLADPLQHYGQDTWIAQDTCNSAMSSGIMEFTLRKKNPPNYVGLVAEAVKLGGQSNQFKADWWVTVVLDRGPDPQNPGRDLSTPLSPPSAEIEFNLFSP